MIMNIQRILKIYKIKTKKIKIIKIIRLKMHTVKKANFLFQDIKIQILLNSLLQTITIFNMEDQLQEEETDLFTIKKDCK
jgi:hypothetical protein